MKLKLSLVFEVTRHEQPTEEQHEHRDNDGTLSENIGHPRYTGFTPEVPNEQGR